MKLTGMPGAVVATLGYITPSCVIVTIIAKLYLKYREMDMLQGILGGIRPAVVALIGSAGNFHFCRQHSGKFPGENGDI